MLFAADLPPNQNVPTAIVSEDTAVLVSDKELQEAPTNLQTAFDNVQRWRIRANKTKFTLITFSIKRETCPPVQLNVQQIPQEDCIVPWYAFRQKVFVKGYIQIKRKQIRLHLFKTYWVVGKSKLSAENKILIYEVFLKQIGCICSSWDGMGICF